MRLIIRPSKPWKTKYKIMEEKCGKHALDM